MSRVRALVYDIATGRIDFVVTCPEEAVEAQARPGQATRISDLGDGGRLWYCPNGVPTLRPTLGFDKYVIAADGEDAATLEMPGPFTVRIDGVVYAAEDILEITSDMAGRYRVVIEDYFPWLDLDVEIVAE
jgi:hypothetical protein